MRIQFVVIIYLLSISCCFCQDTSKQKRLEFYKSIFKEYNRPPTFKELDSFNLQLRFGILNFNQEVAFDFEKEKKRVNDLFESDLNEWNESDNILVPDTIFNYLASRYFQFDNQLATEYFLNHWSVSKNHKNDQSKSNNIRVVRNYPYTDYLVNRNGIVDLLILFSRMENSNLNNDGFVNLLFNELSRQYSKSKMIEISELLNSPFISKSDQLNSIINAIELKIYPKSNKTK